MNVWEEELLKVEFVAKEGRFQSLASFPLRMDVRLIEVMNLGYSTLPFILAFNMNLCQNYLHGL